MELSINNKLTSKKIFRFWLPLAATWLMMSMEGPFIAAIIARLSEPKYNLAAYGVAFSFALIIEAPVIMIMSASTALVKDKLSFNRLRNFTYIINVVITLLMLIFLIPNVFSFIVNDLMELPKKVADLTYIATIILLPWPSAIGYRRFFQGMLIRHNQTRKVAYGTIVRLTMMSLTALILYSYFEFDGVIVGASALSIGVLAEAVVSRLMSNKIIKNLKERKSNKDLTYREIISFYYPLALTSLLGLGVYPMVTFFIGQSRMPLESLAVLPVINSLVFIFRSTGLSFQEVGIALLGEKGQNYLPLRNFAIKLAFFSAGILVIIAVTSLSTLWFHNVSGLSNELTEFAIVPLIIISLMPALSVFLSFIRAILVARKMTAPISPATAIEVVGIIFVLFVLIKGFFIIGAIAAMIAFMVGRFGAILFLLPKFFKIVKDFKYIKLN
jgi:Na+-driven multidrug efflux pump